MERRKEKECAYKHGVFILYSQLKNDLSLSPFTTRVTYCTWLGDMTK